MIKNPILPGFNPDPCIIRVDDDYYIATSTFEWFPAIAIYHSKDLKNWHLLTHVIKNEEDIDLRQLESAKGVWAPDIIYDKFRNKFMVTFTRMANSNCGYKDLDNFYVESNSIMGPWSKPVYIHSIGFDPSLFIDDDGKYYVTSLEWEFRTNHEDPGTIVLQELDIINKRVIGYAKTISSGATDRGCIEAPRIYKRNGYYYLMQAEGGTGYGHSVTLSRSKNIWGPYESKNNSPIVTSHLEDFNDRNVPGFLKPEKFVENGTHLQKSGHGSICETQNGEVYLCHLCGRPILPHACCTLGRETAIQKMKWTDDNWLVMDDESNLAKDEVIESGLKEVLFESENGKSLFEPWPEYLISLRIDKKSWLTVNDNKQAVIRGQQSLSSIDRVSLIAKRLTSLNCEFSTLLDFNPKVFQHIAGIAIYYDNMNYLSLQKTIEDNQLILEIVQFDNNKRIERFKTKLRNNNKLELKATLNSKYINFCYKEIGEEEYKDIEIDFETYKYSDEYSQYGEFTGTFCGIFVIDSNQRKEKATFDYFKYNDL
ncbi:MAG: family 43 glycosylhydrolase [Pleomorphochaeta sp.]